MRGNRQFNFHSYNKHNVAHTHKHINLNGNAKNFILDPTPFDGY